MKIGITGSDGLLGFHVRAFLRANEFASEIRLANRAVYSDSEKLAQFVDGLDAVIHCAGMNRGDEAEVEQVNRLLAQRLVDALSQRGARPVVVFANSTHIDRDTGYGRGKRAAGNTLEAWGNSSGAAVANVVLPHVFGEFGKPFYNSVVSTFCHQLANGDQPKIQLDGELELVHAQDVARFFFDCISGLRANRAVISNKMNGVRMTVSELLGRLSALQRRYSENIVPDLHDPIDLRLFNALRSYLYPSTYPRGLKLHADNRGNLFEAVKTDQGGQTFLSTTHPGITRGNHYHLRKVERFLVIRGEAEIRLRKLFSDELVSFRVTGDKPCFIDIPTFHTHSITNIGASELCTLFWASEIFDPNDADTYAEAV